MDRNLSPEFLPVCRLLCLGTEVAKFSQPERVCSDGALDPANNCPEHPDSANFGYNEHANASAITRVFFSSTVVGTDVTESSRVPLSGF